MPVTNRVYAMIYMTTSRNIAYRVGENSALCVCLAAITVNHCFWQERELAARVLAELACTEADDEDVGKAKQLDLPHLLGIVQMRGNLPAQKAAAEQIAQEVSGRKADWTCGLHAIYV